MSKNIYGTNGVQKTEFQVHITPSRIAISALKDFGLISPFFNAFLQPTISFWLQIQPAGRCERKQRPKNVCMANGLVRICWFESQSPAGHFHMFDFSSFGPILVLIMKMTKNALKTR